MPSRPREFAGQDDGADEEPSRGRSRRRGDRDGDGGEDERSSINVNQATGLADVAKTAITVGGKNVSNFWQLVIVLLLVGGFILAGITVIVVVKYVTPLYLKSSEENVQKVIDNLTEQHERDNRTHKEIADKNIAAFERRSDKDREQHIRQLQLILDRDQEDRVDFERKVGIKTPQ